MFANQWREVESRLRAREVQLNDAERKEKAQQRLRQIEEKQASAALRRRHRLHRLWCARLNRQAGLGT